MMFKMWFTHILEVGRLHRVIIGVLHAASFEGM